MTDRSAATLRLASQHGANVPRGLGVQGGGDAGGGRFGRMFPCLPVRDLSSAAIDALVARLKILSGDVVADTANTSIQAGYTYLGQFVDHDLTFDPSSLRQRIEDPLARASFRTPRFDLDSVYGSGPSDQPFLYEWTDVEDPGVKLLVEHHGEGAGEFEDLPRNWRGRALIGDPRNDENLIVAQIHLLFVRFHNAVVDHVRKRDGLGGPALFSKARRLVRWHYQWIVTHDFLRRIVGRGLAAEAVAPGGGRHCFTFGGGEPFMPVEFSGAAYRFGHSMIRPGYFMGPLTPAEVSVFRVPGGPPDSLRGFRFLPRELVINWRFFFDLGRLPDDLRRFPIPQLSEKIDTLIAPRLFNLPPDVGTDGEPRLARLNLLRGQALRLPAGPDVARAIGEQPLDKAQLELGHATYSDTIAAELESNTPLWYYVLCEASALHRGHHLGPVGGRIVADVLTGLLEADPSSYVNGTSDWAPTLHSTTPGDFLMADLIRFAYPQYRPTP